MRHNFRRLEIWTEGISLTKDTYKLTKHFPKEERFSLTNQIQRAAVSVPSNIAEGTSRKSDKHFVTYLENALGSAYEWETQLIVSKEIGYLEQSQFDLLINKIQNLQGKITRFIEKLEKSLTS
jgi:four helix bundle protein